MIEGVGLASELESRANATLVAALSELGVRFNTSVSAHGTVTNHAVSDRVVSNHAVPLVLFYPKGPIDYALCQGRSYCLAIGEASNFTPLLPANVTFISSQLEKQAIVSDVRAWLEYVDLDRVNPLEHHQLVGRSSAFCHLVANLRSAAMFDAPTLLKGETGTGKEVVARAIHHWSERREYPFVPINCGGQNDDLFVSELFGHERGAFTDAKEKKEGLVAQANGGTLFLDEINSLSAKSQAALLRFLQDQSYRSLGGRRTTHANVRVIAATNIPLDTLIEQGLFRRDLLYRLDVLSVTLPPLRERREDVARLSAHFLQQLCTRYQTPFKALDPHALHALFDHRWLGNVRELQNLMHRLFAIAKGSTVTLPPDFGILVAQEPDHSKARSAPPQSETRQSQNFHDAKMAAISAFERTYLLDLLETCGGNISLAARSSGKERSAFGRLLRKHGISGEQFRGQKLAG